MNNSVDTKRRRFEISESNMASLIVFSISLTSSDSADETARTTVRPIPARIPSAPNAASRFASPRSPCKAKPHSTALAEAFPTARLSKKYRLPKNTVGIRTPSYLPQMCSDEARIQVCSPIGVSSPTLSHNTYTGRNSPENSFEYTPQIKSSQEEAMKKRKETKDGNYSLNCQ